MKASLFFSDGRIVEKNDQTPVTVADFGVQALVSLGSSLKMLIVYNFFICVYLLLIENLLMIHYMKTLLMCFFWVSLHEFCCDMHGLIFMSLKLLHAS